MFSQSFLFLLQESGLRMEFYFHIYNLRVKRSDVLISWWKFPRISHPLDIRKSCSSDIWHKQSVWEAAESIQCNSTAMAILLNLFTTLFQKNAGIKSVEILIKIQTLCNYLSYWSLLCLRQFLVLSIKVLWCHYCIVITFRWGTFWYPLGNFVTHET